VRRNVGVALYIFPSHPRAGRCDGVKPQPDGFLQRRDVDFHTSPTVADVNFLARVFLVRRSQSLRQLENIRPGKADGLAAEGVVVLTISGLDFARQQSSTILRRLSGDALALDEFAFNGLFHRG